MNLWKYRNIKTRFRDSLTGDLSITPFYRRFEIQYSTKFKPNWITGIPCNMDYPFRNPFVLWLIPAYVLPRHPASDAYLDCLSSMILSWIDSENSLLTNREKLQLSSLINYLSLIYPFGPWPITSPYMWS